MNQELIELLRGELSATEEQALRRRLARDPALAGELKELQSLFALMQRHEEVAPTAEGIERVQAAAERSCRPGLVQQLRALPGLVRFRFRYSLGFRVAAVSLCAHLILMGVLFQFRVLGPAQTRLQAPKISFDIDEETPDVRPAKAFVLSLKARRAPHVVRLKRFGVAGQQQAIKAGLDRLIRSQQPDGTFGDERETAYFVLALMAQGDCSVYDTRNGRAIHDAMSSLLAQAQHGKVLNGAMLAALVENWALSYTELSPEERLDYARAMTRLIRNLDPAREAAREGLAIARMAGLELPGTKRLGIFDERVVDLIEREPTRLSVTLVLSHMNRDMDVARVKAWAAPLFERAKAQVAGKKPAPLAVLTLQAPYRW